MDDATRIRRASTFDKIADLYDQGRRETDAQILDDVFAQTALDPSATRVLEIGCGTGQATLPLARRGCNILALEMGANLARIARAKLAAYPCVSILNTRFEDWQPAESFDLVFSVAAWHWLTPQTRYAQAAAALKPDGVLAIVRTLHVFPPNFDPVFQQIQSCYEQIGVASMPWPPPPPESVPDLRDEINSSGFFHSVQVLRSIRKQEFTADTYIALMATASDHRLMDPAKRDRLFNEMRRLINARPNGRILRHALTLLHIARRNP